MWRRVLAALVVMIPVMAVSGCGDSARTPPFARSAALRDHEVREVRVVRLWDQANDRLEDGADPHVSHWVEVDVLAGPGAPGPMTLPYDRWNTGHEPPAVGERLMMTPADWVARDPRTPGRPYGH